MIATPKTHKLLLIIITFHRGSSINISEIIYNNDIGRGKNILPFYPSGFLAEDPVTKDRLVKEKQASLLICVSHIYKGETQGWANSKK